MGRLARKKPLRRTPLRRKGQSAERRAWKERVLARAGHRCERCGQPSKGSGLLRVEAHHIMPKGRGGVDEDWNGAALCGRCHSGVHDHRPGWEAWLARSRSVAKRIRAALDVRRGDD